MDNAININHIPVLLKEVINFLHLKKDGIYLDLTVGLGGHSAEILKRLSKGFLLCVDRDQSAIKIAEKKLSKISNNFKIIKSNFANIEAILNKEKVKKVNGILVDLGVSTLQIQNLERGFSYSNDCLLDMRMDSEQKLDAKKILNTYSFDKLKFIFTTYGDISKPHKLVQNIIKNRPIKTSSQLKKIIYESFPSFLFRKKNLAKPIFQSLRIEVNDELGSLKKMLDQTVRFLESNSSILIITFNSLEDRLVKKAFNQYTKNVYNKLPIQPKKQFKQKIIFPTENEKKENPRAKSAKLRILTMFEE